ncbi:MAG: metal-dependent hydrolase [Candidatus Methanofastidiosia archaeon]
MKRYKLKIKIQMLVLVLLLSMVPLKAQDKIKITYVGHSTFEITGSKKILFDPYLAKNSEEYGFKRLIGAKRDVNQFKDIDFIMITHEHFDHMEVETIKELLKRNDSLVIAPSPVIENLKGEIDEKNLLKVKAGDELEIEGVRIKITGAYHSSKEPVGFLVTLDGVTFYHCGDTSKVDFPQGVDVFFVPIGGTFTMDVEDALKALDLIKPKLTIPMHFDTFSKIEADEERFEREAENRGFEVEVLKPGQTFVFQKEKKKIILLANSIDYELASDLIGFLHNKGHEVIHITAEEFDDYKDEKFIVILGGPDAPEGVGEIVSRLLTEEEKEFLRKEGNRKFFLKVNVYIKGQKIFIFAGSDRWQTRKAHQENRDSIGFY